jgi:hypothetical protein
VVNVILNGISYDFEAEATSFEWMYPSLAKS